MNHCVADDFLLALPRRVMHFTLGSFKPWAWYTLWVIDQVRPYVPPGCTSALYIAKTAVPHTADTPRRERPCATLTPMLWIIRELTDS